MTNKRIVFAGALMGYLALSLLAWAVFDLDNEVISTDSSKGLKRAVNDNLFYIIGDGTVILQSPSTNNMEKLDMGVGWNSDLMCGNFDINTTVKNQLNGITSGFKNMMGNVISSATGAVASQPAMIIQRANLGLYELLTNGSCSFADGYCCVYPTGHVVRCVRSKGSGHHYFCDVCADIRPVLVGTWRLAG